MRRVRVERSFDRCEAALRRLERSQGMLKRGTTWKLSVAALAATVLSMAAVVGPFEGVASAATSISISAGPYTNGQSITVSGTGFPDLTQISMIECSDPGGSVSTLPTDNTTCDGTTENPLPITTNASGNFTTTYQLVTLTTMGGESAINCDSTDFCVLWAGLDFVNSFTGTHAFSVPFEIGSPVTSTPETPVAIALPIGAAVLVAGAVYLSRRRRLATSRSSTPAGRGRPGL
jgi:hypothetical protein